MAAIAPSTERRTAIQGYCDMPVVSVDASAYKSDDQRFLRAVVAKIGFLKLSGARSASPDTECPRYII